MFKRTNINKLNQRTGLSPGGNDESDSGSPFQKPTSIDFDLHSPGAFGEKPGAFYQKAEKGDSSFISNKSDASKKGAVDKSSNKTHQKPSEPVSKTPQIDRTPQNQPKPFEKTPQNQPKNVEKTPHPPVDPPGKTPQKSHEKTPSMEKPPPMKTPQHEKTPSMENYNCIANKK